MGKYFVTNKTGANPGSVRKCVANPQIPQIETGTLVRLDPVQPRAHSTHPNLDSSAGGIAAGERATAAAGAREQAAPCLSAAPPPTPGSSRRRPPTGSVRRRPPPDHRATPTTQFVRPGPLSDPCAAHPRSFRLTFGRPPDCFRRAVQFPLDVACSRPAGLGTEYSWSQSCNKSSGARVVALKDCMDVPVAFVLHLLLKCALAGGGRAALVSTNPVGQSVPRRQATSHASRLFHCATALTLYPHHEPPRPPVPSVRRRPARHQGAEQPQAAGLDPPWKASRTLPARLFRLRASIWTPIPLLQLEGISIATTIGTKSMRHGMERHVRSRPSSRFF